MNKFLLYHTSLIKLIIINLKNLIINIKNLKAVKRKQNPINSRGEISRCNYYSSEFHWANNSPVISEQLDRICI